jgi:hypothetical protein
LGNSREQIEELEKVFTFLLDSERSLRVGAEALFVCLVCIFIYFEILARVLS